MITVATVKKEPYYKILLVLAQQTIKPIKDAPQLTDETKILNRLVMEAVSRRITTNVDSKEKPQLLIDLAFGDARATKEPLTYEDIVMCYNEIDGTYLTVKALYASNSNTVTTDEYLLWAIIEPMLKRKFVVFRDFNTFRRTVL